MVDADFFFLLVFRSLTLEFNFVTLIRVPKYVTKVSLKKTKIAYTSPGG